MAVNATAKAIERKRAKQTSVLVDPGKLEVSPKAEILREQAAFLNPVNQISSILSDFKTKRP
jgi:hypothetical protein